MKNLGKLLGCIAFVAVIGFGMVGCDNDSTEGGGGDPLAGTWIRNDEQAGEMKLVAENGNWRMYGYEESDTESEKAKGIYTINGNSVNITITHLYEEDGWIPYEEMPPGNQGMPPQNIQGTISNNKLTLTAEGFTMEFTKQTGSSPVNPLPPSDPLTGTWTGYNEQAGSEMKLIAENGAFTVYMDDQPAYRGTYTTSGNNVSITFTHINTGLMSGGGEQWTPYADVPPETDGLPPQQTMQGTISGGQLNVEGQTFTKQNTPGPNPGTGGTFTLTGIPEKYIGQYASLRDTKQGGQGPRIFGAQSVTSGDPPFATCVEITGSTITLSMWIEGNNAQQSIIPYTATANVNTLRLIITDQTTVNEHSDDFYATVDFGAIAFTDGSASRAWSSGELTEHKDPPGNPRDALIGTWIGTVEEGTELTLVFADNGTWKAAMGEQAVYRGTYTVTGKDIAFTFTEVNTGVLSGEADEWTAYDELTAEQKENLPNENPTPGTVNGNQLTFGNGDDSPTFTKQP
ncbi:MAG: hypothetical protein LBB72_01255 [Spirochaetaceae bacterium]|jgi:uncharacterized lipoprotein YehR (DUF1307 family)|nr:hypothetical protein [Spirochaetaceae bacterium]